MYKISVIIPYYNSEKTIVRAIESVLDQTYNNIEIILVDDGSTDLSHNLVEDYIKNHSEYNFRHIYQYNSGPSKARNKGIAEAKGEYIAFLDSDDSWHKEKIATQLNYMEREKNIAILGCNHNIVLGNTIIKKSKGTGGFIKVGFYNRLFKNYFSTPTILVRKKVINELNGFNELQRYSEDALLVLRILRKYDGGKIQESLVDLYKNEYGDSGLSTHLKELEQCELNNFKLLRQENRFYDKKINILLYIVIKIFSLIKYIRRILIVKIREVQ